MKVSNMGTFQIPNAADVAHRKIQVQPTVRVREWRVRLASTSGRRCDCCGLPISRNQWYVRVVRKDDMLEMYHYAHFWSEFGVRRR